MGRPEGEGEEAHGRAGEISVRTPARNHCSASRTYLSSAKSGLKVIPEPRPPRLQRASGRPPSPVAPAARPHAHTPSARAPLAWLSLFAPYLEVRRARTKRDDTPTRDRRRRRRVPFLPLTRAADLGTGGPGSRGISGREELRALKPWMDHSGSGPLDLRPPACPTLAPLGTGGGPQYPRGLLFAKVEPACPEPPTPLLLRRVRCANVRSAAEALAQGRPPHPSGDLFPHKPVERRPSRRITGLK